MDARLARRGFLTGAAGWAVCTACAAQHPDVQGCALRPEQAGAYFDRTTSSFRTGDDIRPRSGNAQLDRALAQSLGMLSRMFDVLPGFAYYRDDGAPNAKATSAVLLERTDGTVLFGLSLLQELLALPANGDAAVVAVCAHEFGHIVSFRRGLQQQLTQDGSPFRGEQFADYLAGYFSGRRRRDDPSFPAVAFAMTQRSFGGRTRGSHGTGPERGAAVQAGYVAAYDQGLSVEDAISAGNAYALRVI